MRFSDLFNAYLKLHLQPHCRSAKKMEVVYNKYLAPWGDREAESITKFEVLELHGRLAAENGKTTANRVLQLLSPIFNKGIDWGLINCPNPTRGVKAFRIAPRERFLEKDELDRFFLAVDSIRYEVTRDFLLMCLFTGARFTNVASMKWSDLSIERCVWRIPMTKNGDSGYVPLVPEAMAILQRRYQKRKSDYVFPSARSKSGHLTKPHKAWVAIKHRAQLGNVTIHDLRRTLASWEALTGANISSIAATLHHKSFKSTWIYAKLNTSAVRQAMSTAVNAMTAL